MKILIKSLLVIMFLFGVGVQFVSATTISYEIVDLADTIEGEDLWQYRYYVDVENVSHPTYYTDQVEQGDYLTIQFQWDMYENLELVSDSTDWNTQVYENRMGTMGEVGLYAMALGDDSSLENPFIVNFNWIGDDMPGAQYAGYQCTEASGEFGDGMYTIEKQYAPSTEIDPGTGTDPVPEPATCFLLGSGLIGFFISRKKK